MDREHLEVTKVEFNEIFVCHRLDIGMNTQFKVSLASKDDKPTHKIYQSQSISKTIWQSN